MTISLVPPAERAARAARRLAPAAVRLSARTRLGVVVPPLVATAVIIGVWQALTVSGTINQIILPTPVAVAQAFGSGWSVLWHNAWFTIIEAVSGFFVGNLVAVALAVAFVHSDTARHVAYPLALAAQSIPIVAAAPALVLWLGNGMAPKIFVAAFLVFFPTLVNMIRGLRSADVEAEELLDSLSASPLQRLLKVRLPASLPYLFTALKLAATSCFVGAVVAEWIGSSQGVGYLIVFDSSQFEVGQMWAAIFLGALLSLLFYGLVVGTERCSARWLPREAPAE
jgi:NitT/TauT family transport system permease protein